MSGRGGLVRRVTEVILWQNGMVMVFDQFGDQMPDYQGKVDDVRDNINRVFSGKWHAGLGQEVTHEPNA